jgi:hypothetical protein
MFDSGSSTLWNSGFLDRICAKVEGMSCISPRAPARLAAAESRPLSVSAWALNSRQSHAGPKKRRLYLRNVASYRSVGRGAAAGAASASRSPASASAFSSGLPR